MHTQAGVACIAGIYTVGVTFVEIQHTLGDANGSAIGGDGNEGPGRRRSNDRTSGNGDLGVAR
jgi:hypothetical protein